MKTYKITYDTVQDYDPEYSFWNRVIVCAESYEQASDKFHKDYPGNKIFSVDEVDEDGNYVYDYRGNSL